MEERFLGLAPMVELRDDKPKTARAVCGHRLDPCTGNCSDCGATREQMDDNLVLFDICQATLATGPHRIALIAARMELIRRRDEIVGMQQRLSAGRARRADIKEQMEALTQEIVRKNTEYAELQATIKMLDQASGNAAPAPADAGLFDDEAYALRAREVLDRGFT